MTLRYYAFILAFCILMGGCKTQHLPYHSTASLPHYSQDIQTDMVLVEGEGRRARAYAVIAAVDDGTLPYVLLAPLDASNNAYRLENALLWRSAPLLRANAEELIDGLNQTLALWNRKPQGEEGAFYEFNHAPEQDIVQVSKSVVEWKPSVRFTFSHTPDGPSARLQIGYHPTNELVRLIAFEEQEAVADFKQLLENALLQLDMMQQEGR